MTLLWWGKKKENKKIFYINEIDDPILNLGINDDTYIDFLTICSIFNYIFHTILIIVKYYYHTNNK